MIELKTVEVRNGETTLFLEADGFPEGIREIEIPLSELIQKLKIVREILGRPVTLEDAKSAIITLVNQIRKQESPLTERFDFSKWIGADLEAEG